MRALFFLLAFMASASAQPVGMPFVGGTAAASYAGPGDVTATFDFWCGLRAFSKATAGTKSVNVTRASDSTNTDINTTANGDFDTASASTFCNATTCSIRRCYDKSGNAHDMALSGGGYQLVFNCLNATQPCMQVTTSSSNGMVTSSYTPGNSNFSMTLVVNRSSGTGTADYLFPANSGANIILGSTANLIRLSGGSAGAFTATMTDGAWHAVNSVCRASPNGTSSLINVDGSGTTGNATCIAVSGGGGSSGATSTTVRLTELGSVGSASFWNSTTISAMQANQKAYWATP